MNNLVTLEQIAEESFKELQEGLVIGDLIYREGKVDFITAEELLAQSDDVVIGNTVYHGDEEE